MERIFQFGGVEVKVIDRTPHTEREQRLQQAIKDFYYQKEKENETNTKRQLQHC